MATLAPSRRQSKRQPVRSSTTRPINYYARNFSGLETAQNTREREPGFFPAITQFTDAVTALPKEVISQLTMLKEVEAKVHGPEQDLLKLADEISALPPAQRYQSTGQTAAQSLAGSVNGSVYNGNASPAAHHSGREIQSSQLRVDDLHTSDMNRRQLCKNLSVYIHALNPILDEKIAVLHTANESLRMQLERMHSIYPFIDLEISEEARLGSTSHWAYVDRGETKKPGPTAGRGVRAYADADGDMAASRSEARREAMLAKKHRSNQVDSDFEDRPPSKKPHGNKGRKHGDGDKSVGLGITNGAGQPKRRKIEKGTEKAMAGTLAQVKGAAGSPRETPGSEFAPVKRKKPGPAPGTKKKCFASSLLEDLLLTNDRPPPLASSPALQPSTLAGSSTRPNAGRGRQNSQATLLNEKARPASAASNRPPTAAGTPALKPSDSMVAAETETMAGGLPAGAQPLKQEESNAEDTNMAGQEPESMAAVTMTTRGARASKTATPVTGTFPSDALGARARSTRNIGNGNGGAAEANGAGTTGKRGHKKGAASIAQSIYAAGSTSNSRRGSLAAAEQAAQGDVGSAPAPERASTRPQRNRRSAVHEDEALDINDDDDADEAEGEEGEGGEGSDEDEENEPKYCYCNDSGYGMMVGCDNDDCQRAWFHLSCVGLKEAPAENGKRSRSVCCYRGHANCSNREVVLPGLHGGDGEEEKVALLVDISQDLCSCCVVAGNLLSRSGLISTQLDLMQRAIAPIPVVPS